MSTTRRWLALASVLLTAGAAGAGAQTPDNSALAAITALSCEFPMFSSGTWSEGAPAAEITQAGVLRFDLTEIDAPGGSALYTGLSRRPEDIVAQLMGWSLHFVDMRSTGRLALITVFGQESREGRLKAVFSRADYVPISVPGFEAVPEVSQHYGECTIVESTDAAP